MLVSTRQAGVRVFPPETPRGESRHGVLRESATWLSARPAAADFPSAGGVRKWQGGRPGRLNSDHRHSAPSGSLTGVGNDPRFGV